MPGPAAPHVEPEPDAPLAMRWSIGRVAAVVAVVAIALFWLWIFSGAPKKANPDRLTDRTYAASLETRCKAALDQIDELPSPVTIKDPEVRADQVDTVTAILDDMLDDIEADAPKQGGAAVSMKGWLKDWRTYLEDRRDFTKRLREDPTERFLVSVSPLGDSVDKTIEIFTQVNDIPSCATPGDIG